MISFSLISCDLRTIKAITQKLIGKQKLGSWGAILFVCNHKWVECGVYYQGKAAEPRCCGLARATIEKGHICIAVYR